MCRERVPDANSFLQFDELNVEKYGNLAEMDPYGSVWADITTGKSPMAPDHFKTPPDPKKGHGMTKNP